MKLFIFINTSIAFVFFLIFSVSSFTDYCFKNPKEYNEMLAFRAKADSTEAVITSIFNLDYDKRKFNHPTFTYMFQVGNQEYIDEDARTGISLNKAEIYKVHYLPTNPTINKIFLERKLELKEKQLPEHNIVEIIFSVLGILVSSIFLYMHTVNFIKNHI